MTDTNTLLGWLNQFVTHRRIDEVMDEADYEAVQDMNTHLRAQEARIAELAPWKEAVIDALAVCCGDCAIGTPPSDVLKLIASINQQFTEQNCKDREDERIAALTKDAAPKEEVRKQMESETFEEYDWFYKLKFICRVLGNNGNAPKEDWQTAHGMAKSLFNSAWLVQREKAELTKDAEPLSTTFIQTVPDKCDRIVWRGDYFHLPPKISHINFPTNSMEQEFANYERRGYEKGLATANTHPPAPNQAQWQLIETAPHGKVILGFIPHSMGGYVCPTLRIKLGSWNNASCAAFSEVNPTHWMPLPKPPIAAAVNAFNGVKP